MCNAPLLWGAGQEAENIAALRISQSHMTWTDGLKTRSTVTLCDQMMDTWDYFLPFFQLFTTPSQKI